MLTACVNKTLENCENNSTLYDFFVYMQGLMSLWLKVDNFTLAFQ